MLVGESDKFLESMITDNRVWIQDQHILTLSRTNSRVIAFGEAEVGAILNNLHCRKIAPNVLPRAISRAVVGDDYLEADFLCLVEDRRQTLTNHLPVVPTNYYNRELHFGRLRGVARAFPHSFQ